MEADCAFHSKSAHHLEQSHICRRVIEKNLLFHKSWKSPPYPPPSLRAPFPKCTAWLAKWLIIQSEPAELPAAKLTFFFFFSPMKDESALRLTCWRGRGSFESSRRPCLSSLTAGARWWPSRSPCWAQRSSHQCLQMAPRWVSGCDLSSLWPGERLLLLSDSWETGFIIHLPIVEFPEASPWHNDRMWGVYLWVELWVIFNTRTDLEDKSLSV